MTEPQSTELDLDDLLQLENMFLDQGREDGLRDGKPSGIIEGRILGSKHGFQLAQEIGFYNGVAETWTHLIQQNPKVECKGFNERTVKHLNSLRELISQFPIENKHTVEVPELLERIRAKYKVVISLLCISKNSQKFQDTGGKISY
ncbi:hypothetical protein G9A89_015931 [Geosiphon pyriformis]|nr:hypothetical protein G9A89_015931 [Geosiphon pyriformis]